MLSQDKYRIALLSAYAIGLHGLESLLPSPIPWLKFGLANIITLITLMLYGFRAAIMVTLIRVLVSSLIFGTFPGPAFVLSLGGGVVSTAAMAAFLSVFRGLFSAVGLSLIGAFFHNITQLILAYFLLIQRIEPILFITPLILFLGTLTGLINGTVSELVIRHLRKSS
jgi:heptaprenyl diphosphate synthase